MKWKIRHYGRSYLYDRLHRGAVTIVIGLTILGFSQLALMTVPVITGRLMGANKKVSQVEEENKSDS